jgi:O-antigen/teichoic acid export membrane protein
MLRTKANNFYVRSGLFSLLSITGAAFNYALYPVLVRILNKQEFGDFAAITALSNQILGILLAFNIISIYLVKSMEEHAARRHAQNIQRLLIWVFVFAAIALLLLSPLLYSILRIQDFGSFFLLSALLIIAVPGVIWTGYLQGHKELIRIGISSLSASIGKFVLAVILAALFGVIGGVWGVLGGTVLGLLVLMVVPGVKLPTLRSFFHKSSAQEKRFLLSIRNYIVISVLVVGSLSFLQNFDIILAKALFEPNIAGTYSGISILSNALYFVAFLLIWIILPEIELGNAANNRRILGTAYKLLVAAGVVVVILEVLGQTFLTKILLGPEFAGQGVVLIFASLYQLTLVGVTLHAYYLLVNKKMRAGILGLTILLSSVMLPVTLSKTPLQMIAYLWLSLIASWAFYGLITQVIDRYKHVEQIS